MEANRVLVTGAAGFIGGELLYDLKSAGFEVLGIDNFSDYYSHEMKHRHLESKLLSKLVRDIDVTNRLDVSNEFRKFQPNIVVHLAAQGGVRASRVNPLPYIMTNQLGFLNMLEISESSGVSKFVYASSSSVYGDATSGPFIEDRQLNAPKSLYASSKYANELIARYLPATTEMNRIGLRFFTVYGPWGRPDMAVFRLLSSALLGTKFKLSASLDTIRDFTYVSDVSKFVLSLCEPEKSFGSNEVFNVAGGKPYSMRELFEVMHRLQIPITIENIAVDELDVKLTHGSTSKIQEMGLFVPNTTLDEGIQQAWAWLLSRELHEIKKWSE